MKGVSGGKLEGGRTEWKIEVILPVAREMTIVAAVSWPDTMAREEVRTVIGGCCAVDIVEVLFVAEKRLMVPSTQRGYSAMISLESGDRDRKCFLSR